MAPVDILTSIQGLLLTFVIPFAIIMLIIGAVRMNRGDHMGLRIIALSVAAVIVVGVGPQALRWFYTAAQQVQLPAAGR